MKRIVQCPKCEAKLAIFDFGKPINQKCPKCGNAFVVGEEKAKTESEVKTPPTPTTPPAQTDAPTKSETDKSPVVPAPKEHPLSAKEPTPEGKLDDKLTPKDKPADTPSDKNADKPIEKKVPIKEAVSEKPESKEVRKTEAKRDLAPQKEISLKKPIASASSTPAVKPMPKYEPSALDDIPLAPVSHSGISFLHVIVIIGLLMLSIVVQVMGKKAAEKHYVDLAERLSRVEAKLMAIGK